MTNSHILHKMWCTLESNTLVLIGFEENSNRFHSNSKCYTIPCKLCKGDPNGTSGQSQIWLCIWTVWATPELAPFLLHQYIREEPSSLA